MASPSRGKKVSDYMVKLDKPDQPKPNRKRKVALEAEYERRIVNGVTILLPPGLKPYASQQLMMVKIIQALKNKKHALIESPTGSGKSLGLLSACCAWLQEYNIKRRMAMQTCPKHGTTTTNAEIEKIASDAKILRINEAGPSESNKENFKPDLLNFSKNEVIDLTQDDSDYDAYGKAQDKQILDNIEHQPEAECTCSEMKKIRIYYGTRTHRQISQVVKEFARLPYGHEKDEKQLRHTILASREQSCLNQDVRKSNDLTAACRERIAPDGIGCIYRQHLRAFEDPNKLRIKIDHQGGGVWDIEDLSEALKTPEICPYFASTRTLTNDADIIFTPFNYLLDLIIRKSSDVILKNTIIILDEAHNVEDTCRSAVSFQFKESEFIAAFQSFHEKLASMNDHSLLDRLKSNTTESNNKSENLQEIEKYKESLKRMYELTKRIYNFFCELGKLLDTNKVNCKSWNCEPFFALLKNDDPQKNLYFEKDDILFNEYLSDFNIISAQKSRDENAGDIFSELIKEFKVSSVSIVLIEKYLFFMQCYQMNKELYKCNITVTPQQQNLGIQKKAILQQPKSDKDSANFTDNVDGIKMTLKPIRIGSDATLNFWCMSPSVACSEAFKECHSVILASGTLCPIETLKTELGMKFDYEMEGDQVIPQKQIFASVVSKGPHNYPFNCTYKNMQDQTFYVELLRTIRDVCKTVPKGILVFVSSYRILIELQKFIKFENLRSDIEKHKKIFYEPTKSSDLKQVLEEYTFAIETYKSDVSSLNGAIMFAVFRGKVSEGIDFTDDMARCVICVGIPFPNCSDELVIQKKSFNDLHSRSNKKILSGDEWYSTQAYRALNQALGRCLRHRNDWGAILLVDERFIEKADPKCADSKKISRWVRNSLMCYNDHKSLITALSLFVAERIKDPELKPVKKEIVIDIDDNDPAISSQYTPTQKQQLFSPNRRRNFFPIAKPHLVNDNDRVIPSQSRAQSFFSPSPRRVSSAKPPLIELE